eukprot:9748456-Alexandrium_andersonii.AAC.1
MFADRIEQQLVRGTRVDFLPSGQRSKPSSVQKKPLMQHVEQKTMPWRSCEGRSSGCNSVSIHSLG